MRQEIRLLGTSRIVLNTHRTITRWECNTETPAERGITAANCFVYKIELYTRGHFIFYLGGCPFFGAPDDTRC